MSWKLWIDDQLDDPETPGRHTPYGFWGAKSSEEAIGYVQAMGLPSFMDLDHDLGGDDTVMVFLCWLATTFPEGPVPDYRVHSMNGIGAKSIESYLESWKRSLTLSAGDW